MFPLLSLKRKSFEVMYLYRENFLYLSLVFCLLVSFGTEIFAIKFELEPHLEKCLKEDLGSDVLVNGSLEVETIIQEMQLSFRILDSNGHICYQIPDFTSQKVLFSFTTQVEGDHSFCLMDQARPGYFSQGQKRFINLRFSIDQDEKEKDYIAMAKKENLKPIELNLRRMEDLIREVEQDMMVMKEREALHRDTSELTNSRVKWVSIFSVAVMILSSIFQLWLLKRFLKTRKLI